MSHIITQLVVILLYCQWRQVYPVTNYHLTDFALNASALSITSFGFNEDHIVPDWVDHALGSRAVYWKSDRDYHHYPDNDYRQIPKARANFVRYNNAPLPEHALHPRCSIEMVGFVRLGKRAPFRGMVDRLKRPSTGQAFLVPQDPHRGLQPWTCYYRAMYENWRQSDHKKSFWAVFFFCPAASKKHTKCKDFKLAHKANEGRMHLKLFMPFNTSNQYDSKGRPHTLLLQQRESSSGSPGPGHAIKDSESYGRALLNDSEWRLGMERGDNRWSISFTTFYSNVTAIESKALTSEALSNAALIGRALGFGSTDTLASPGIQSAINRVPSLDMAVCTAWPYATSHPDKIAANQALVYEFMRYYANLGMKVFVYDRDGANARGAFNTAYARANPQRGLYTSAVGNYLHYHNFTIHSLILPHVGATLSDMEGTSKGDRMLYNNDRSLTYSHCRFEARVRYNISKVLLIDFDEFLYCKRASPSPRAQAEYLRTYMEELRRTHNIDQVMLGKTTVSSRSALSVHACAQMQLQLNRLALEAKLGSSRDDMTIGSIISGGGSDDSGGSSSGGSGASSSEIYGWHSQRHGTTGSRELRKLSNEWSGMRPEVSTRGSASAPGTVKGAVGGGGGGGGTGETVKAGGGGAGAGGAGAGGSGAGGAGAGGAGAGGAGAGGGGGGEGGRKGGPSGGHVSRTGGVGKGGVTGRSRGAWEARLVALLVDMAADATLPVVLAELLTRTAVSAGDGSMGGVRRHPTIQPGSRGTSSSSPTHSISSNNVSMLTATEASAVPITAAVVRNVSSKMWAHPELLQGSLFNCLASIKHVDEIPNVKSVQLNHKCPVSSMHHACAPCPVRKPLCSHLERRFEAYDCICESAQRTACDFVHLSLVESKYKHRSPAEMAWVRESHSELWNITNTYY